MDVSLCGVRQRHEPIMELTPLRYLLAIAETGHMTRAAQALGVTQPTLSAMLKKLEGETGTELFHRSARGVVPTDAGRVFIRHAENAVRAADLAMLSVRELIGLESGRVRIGGGATATGELLPGVIGEMHQEHPALRFEVREAGSESVARSVLHGELDLGVVTLPVRVPGANELFNVAEFRDELLLVVPPHHRLAGSTTFAWSDLAGEPLVSFERGSAVRKMIDDAADGAGVQLQVVVELRSVQSMLRMIESGVGVGFVSKFALGKGHGLSCAARGELERTLAIVRRRDRVPNHAAAAFERALLRTIDERARPLTPARPVLRTG